MIAAFAGVVDASQLSSGQPEIGADYLLPAYAGAFLGATTINLGQFNVWGTVIGVYLLGAGVAGLQELGLGSVYAGFLRRRCTGHRRGGIGVRGQAPRQRYRRSR